MNITKDTFAQAGKTMIIPNNSLDDDLKKADLDGSQAIDSVTEFADLYVRAEAGGIALSDLTALMQQAPAPHGVEDLGDRKLKGIEELASVFSGVGQIVKARGVTLGSKVVQQALNFIADHLPNFPKCDVGNADGKFGNNTQKAVTAFQKETDLPQTRVVNAITILKMDEVLARARTMPVNKVITDNLSSIKVLTYNDRSPGNCCFTFDDGPDPDTNKVLDALKAAGVKGCTFFVQGKNVRAHPEIVKRIIAEGHVLGNHTYDHPDLRKISATEINKQLDKCQAAVNDALGYEYPMTQMRPPYGALNNRAKGVIAGKGLSVILWAVDSNDWRRENRRNTNNIVDNVFAGSAPVTGGRAVVLFHDIHPSTGDVLPKILAKSKDANLNMTMIDSLLEEKYGA